MCRNKPKLLRCVVSSTVWLSALKVYLGFGGGEQKQKNKTTKKKLRDHFSFQSTDILVWGMCDYFFCTFEGCMY